MMYRMPWSDRVVNGVALIVMGCLFLRVTLPFTMSLATAWLLSITPDSITPFAPAYYFYGIGAAFASMLFALSPIFIAHKVLRCLFREMMQQ